MGSHAAGHARRTALTVAVGALLATTAGAVPAGAAHAAAKKPAVCRGVPDCHRVKQIDVNGDGRRDGVGMVNRVSDGSGTVTVHVRLSTGRRLAKTRRVEYWYGPVWSGAARLDGRRGAELFLGRSSGAHALLYQVLTIRKGKLVLLRAPGGAKEWLVDGAYSMNVGFWRRVNDGKVFVTRRSAVRNASGHGHHGRDVRYRWRSGWHKVSSTKRRYAKDKVAFGIGGWHVKGLRRFP